MRTPATASIRAKAAAVAATANHKATMSANASGNDLALKNRNDHAMFRTSCAPKRTNATPLPALVVAAATRAAAIPMSTYKIVHTGPNAAGGGIHAGLRNVWYHGDWMSVRVAKPVAAPRSSGAIANNQVIARVLQLQV